MKRIDFYVQMILATALLGSMLATYTELPLMGIKVASFSVLGIWQICSALLATLNNEGNYLEVIALRRYWTLAVSILLLWAVARWFTLQVHPILYLLIGLLEVYYLMLTQRFAFYRKNKALW